MKKVIWLLTLFITLNAANAAEKTSRELAEELLDVVGMEQVLTQSIDQMLALQLQQNPAMAPYQDTMKAFFRKHMSYQSLKPDLTALYGDAFSQRELKDLIEFYNTPTGKKTITVMPTLMSRGAQIGAKRVQDNVEELQSMIAAESQRLQQLQTQ